MVQKNNNKHNPPRQSVLFLGMPRSDFADFLRKSDEFIRENSDLLEDIDDDLDEHALQKKKLRKLDRAWENNHNTQSLPGFKSQQTEMDTEELKLKQGRPRTSAYVVFLLMMTRAYHGGVSTMEFQDIVAESKSLDVLIRVRGENRPERSTISELLNAVSNSTRDKIHRRQIDWIERQDLDDFEQMYQDSTDVEADTEFPNDASIIRKLLERIWRNGQKLEEFGLEEFKKGHTENRLEKVRKAELKIKFADHKGTRKKQYRRVYEFAEKAARHLDEERVEFEKSYLSGSLKPSREKQLEEMRDQIRQDLEDVQKVIAYSRKRVLEGGTTPSTQKVLSIADSDAAFIKKGDRDPVVGYRPQIARSEKGFIPVVRLPSGNAADAPQMIPAVDEWEEVTGKVPVLYSSDDGYADGESVKELFSRGADVVSISGAKGKEILGDQLYYSDKYREARRKRSKVESSIFVLKEVYEFDRASRRGEESVRAELLEDVIAHNFVRVVQLQSEIRHEQKKSLRQSVG